MAQPKPSPASPVLGQETVKAASLNPFHRNPRIGNIPLIVESVERLGQYKPLVVNRGTLTGRPDEVLAGNQTLAALLKLGVEDALVSWIDVDDETADRIVLIDNRASDKGSYDNALLAELLDGLPDLGATGYTDGDLTRLLNGLDDEEIGLTDPDAAGPKPEPEDTITREGDVWLLGRHRLICGSSTSGSVLQRLVDGRAIDALWTDPPYGVDYVGKTKDALTIKNDTKGGLAELLLHAFQASLTVLRPGAPAYIAHADTERVTFELALREAGYLVRQNLIWVKNTMVLGRSDYQYKHEPILEAETPPAASEDDEAAGDQLLEHEPVLYGFTPNGEGRLGRGGDRWYGNNKQTTVFEVNKPAASRLHPTMKPVELITKQLRNSVVRGGAVLDLFAGSGSTLIAAFQLHLDAYLVELDPAYCDVICKRWEEHSGVMPIREGEGPVSFLPEEG